MTDEQRKIWESAKKGLQENHVEYIKKLRSSDCQDCQTFADFLEVLVGVDWDWGELA